MVSKRPADCTRQGPNRDRLADVIASMHEREDDLTPAERVKLRALEVNLRLMPHLH